MTEAAVRRLLRRPDDGKIGGVCAGMAVYFDVDVVLVRGAWIVLSIWPGAVVFGILAYLAAWILMPRADSPAPASSRPRLVRSGTDRRIAGVCGGLGEYFGVDSTLIRVAWIILSVVPGLIFFGLLWYAVAWFVMPRGPMPILHASPSTT